MREIALHRQTKVRWSDDHGFSWNRIGKAEPLDLRSMIDLLQPGPAPFNMGWSGGRQYAARYPIEDEYYFTGSYEWTRYVGLDLELVLHASKRDTRKSRGYFWSLELRYKRDRHVNHKLTESGRAKNLQEIFDKAQAATGHLDIWVESLLEKVYQVKTVHCVYTRVQGEWRPFCSHFPSAGSFEGDYYLLGGRKDHAPCGWYLMIGPGFRFPRRAAQTPRIRSIKISGSGSSSGGPLPHEEVPELTWWCYNSNPEVPPIPAAGEYVGTRPY